MIRHITSYTLSLYLYLLKLTANITSCFVCLIIEIVKCFVHTTFKLKQVESVATTQGYFGISFDPQICSLADQGRLTHSNQCGLL